MNGELGTLKAEVLEDVAKVISRMTTKNKLVCKIDVANDKGKVEDVGVECFKCDKQGHCTN